MTNKSIAILIGDYWDKVRSLILKKKEGQLQNYCDCLVFNKDGDFLILKRTKLDDFEPNKWCLPGGKQENDELLIEGCVRELAEETNIVFNPFDDTIKSVINYTNPDDSISHYFYVHLIEFVIPVLDVDEHIDYKWISISEIEDYDFLFDLGERLQVIVGKIIDRLEHEAINGVSLTNEYESFDKGEISDTQFFEFLKANQTSFVNDPSHGGRLVKHQFVNRAGKIQTKWVTKDKLNGHIKDTDKKNKESKGHLSNDQLKDFAGKVSTDKLKNFIKKTKNDRLKQIALDEINKRTNE